MARLPAPVDYTDLDFNALRARLIRLGQSAFPDLDLDGVAELATLLLDANAFVGDVLAFYLRKTGREAHFATATQRRSLLALVKLIGYRSPGATAARAQVTFTLGSAAVARLTLRRGTIVKTAEVTVPIRFQLLEDLVFLPGETSKTALVEHSKTLVESFASTNQPNQRFTLRERPYLDGSATPTAANGAYTEVASFLNSLPSDRHFVTLVDELDRCTLTFGNGVNGTVPIGDVAIEYKTGGGSTGRVGPGKLVQIEGSFADELGNRVRVSVTNVEKAEGGTDRANVEQIREQAPESLRLLERAVAREDFEIGARRVPGVARALCLTLDEDSAVGENAGNLYVVPDDAAPASPALLEAVRAQFLPVAGHPRPPTPVLNTFRLRVFEALYLVVDVTAKVHLRRNAVPVDVRKTIGAALADLFAVRDLKGALNPRIDFGYFIQDADGAPTHLLAFSDIFNAVRDAAGVLKISDDPDGFLLNGARRDVPIQKQQFPRLGTVTILHAGTGQPL